MIPGVNPRQRKQMMRQLGMSQEDVDAKKVIIETLDKKYVFENPQVQKVSMQGQITFQVVGDFSIEDVDEKFEVTDEDIEMVMKKAEVDAKKAEAALKKNDGDIAEAILELKGEN